MLSSPLQTSFEINSQRFRLFSGIFRSAQTKYSIMGFLQEQTFAAFLALVFSTLLLAKIVSFAISSSANEGPVTRQMTKSPKARKKKVRFVDDDVVVKRLDLFETLQLLDDTEPVGETIVEENENPTEKKWFDTDGAFLEIQKSSGTSGVKSAFDDDDDDDWEGIERSELEKVFAEAVNYLEYEYGDNKLPGDVRMELYGLHKVAVEGSCHEAQPMALKLSARAKWNAWQRLGGMSQVSAMEQYIKVLSDNIPDWMQDYASAEVGAR